MKKLSLFLSLMLTLLSVFPTYAQTYNPVTSDLESLGVAIETGIRELGEEIELVSLDFFNKNKDNDNISIFTEYKNDIGDTVFEFQEEGLYNKVEYKVSGDVYLNGEPVTIAPYVGNSTYYTAYDD